MCGLGIWGEVVFRCAKEKQESSSRPLTRAAHGQQILVDIVVDDGCAKARVLRVSHLKGRKGTRVNLE